jgi:hypothetical protein
VADGVTVVVAVEVRAIVAEAADETCEASGVTLGVCEPGTGVAGAPAKNIQAKRRIPKSRSAVGSLLRQAVYISAVIHQVHFPRLVYTKGRNVKASLKKQCILPGTVWIAQQSPHSAAAVVSIQIYALPLRKV